MTDETIPPKKWPELTAGEKLNRAGKYAASISAIGVLAYGVYWVVACFLPVAQDLNTSFSSTSFRIPSESKLIDFFEDSDLNQSQNDLNYTRIDIGNNTKFPQNDLELVFEGEKVYAEIQRQDETKASVLKGIKGRLPLGKLRVEDSIVVRLWHDKQLRSFKCTYDGGRQDVEYNHSDLGSTYMALRVMSASQAVVFLAFLYVAFTILRERKRTKRLVTMLEIEKL